MKCTRHASGFTIIELLIVVVLAGMVLSVALPVSYGMYETYQASLRAQEVMVYVSEVRRNAFLYSERKVIAAQDGQMTVDGEKKIFQGIRIHLSEPIIFFRNGTSSGGTLLLSIGDTLQSVVVHAPLGGLSLERGGT